MKNVRRLKSIGCSFISVLIVSLAVLCVSVRLPQCVNKEDVVVAAATLTMSKGSYETIEQETTMPTEATTATVETTVVTEETTADSSNFDSEYYNTFAKHVNAEKYPVYTKQYTATGMKYQNFYVKNSTSYDLDIEKTLNSELGFKIDDSDAVQVLIYHTHTCESYLDCDVRYYDSDYYPRTGDSR